MKNFALIVLLALTASSCGLFQKSSMSQEEIDALVAKNQALEKQAQDCKDLNNQLAAANAEIQNLRSQLTSLQEATKGKFEVIVGAFKVPSNAQNYSATIKNQGYEGKIEPGPYGFDLVTYSSHESLVEALRAMDQARMNVIDNAWVYIRR